MQVNITPALLGFIHGLELANDATSPDTAIAVARGVATAADGSHLMHLTSATTKVLQSSGAWSAGGGGNGLDTGTRTANTWYHVFLIRGCCDGTEDILFSSSVGSPTLPSGYVAQRRIGSVRTNSSGNILPFTQTGNEFIWFNAPYDLQDVTNVGTTSTLFALTVPSGVKVLARIRFAAKNTGGAGYQFVARSPDENSAQTSGYSAGSGFQLDTFNATHAVSGEFLVRTNTASQIAIIAFSNSNNTVWLRTVGWFDDRN